MEPYHTSGFIYLEAGRKKKRAYLITEQICLNTAGSYTLKKYETRKAFFVKVMT